LLSFPSALEIWKRLSRTAASAVAATIITASAASAETIAQRSVRLLPLTVAFDTRTADAFGAKSLPALTKLYAELGAQASATEAARKSGQDACGCDVALANLRIIVGFAINKLDGVGRYQAWMRADSLRLHGEYAGYVADCAADAGAPASPVRLQAKQLKGL
jgi:hypothetical protein